MKTLVKSIKNTVLKGSVNDPSKSRLEKFIKSKQTNKRIHWKYRLKKTRNFNKI